MCVCAHVYVRVHHLRNSVFTDTDGSNTGILQLSEVQRQKACWKWGMLTNVWVNDRGSHQDAILRSGAISGLNPRPQIPFRGHYSFQHPSIQDCRYSSTCSDWNMFRGHWNMFQHCRTVSSSHCNFLDITRVTRIAHFPSTPPVLKSCPAIKTPKDVEVCLPCDPGDPSHPSPPCCRVAVLPRSLSSPSKMGTKIPRFVLNE